MLGSGWRAEVVKGENWTVIPKLAVARRDDAEKRLALKPERMAATDRLVAARFGRRPARQGFPDTRLDRLQARHLRRRVPGRVLRPLLVQRIDRAGAHQLRQQAAEQIQPGEAPVDGEGRADSARHRHNAFDEGIEHRAVAFEERRRQEMTRRMGGADKVKRQHDGGRLTVYGDVAYQQQVSVGGIRGSTFNGGVRYSF